MSLIAHLATAGITMSREEVSDNSPADVAMLMADVEYSCDFLSRLPEAEQQDLVDAQELANFQVAMESLVDFHQEASYVHRQFSSEGMKNAIGLKIGSLRLAEMRERVGFSNLSFSPESHEELIASSEGFLKSIWDTIVKVAKAIKNFFKRLFGMDVEDEEGGSSSVNAAAVENTYKTLNGLVTDKSITVPKDVFEKSIMSLRDTSDVTRLKEGIQKLKTGQSWFEERQRQIVQLLTAAEGLTPMDMEAQFVSAVTSLQNSSEHSKKDTVASEAQEVIKGGFLYGFSSGRSLHAYMCRESGKPELKFKTHLFEDKPNSYSDMTVSTPSAIAGLFKDYQGFQTHYISFVESFGKEVMARQEKFEKWAEDHAKRNADDAEKESMSKLLASIRSTQGLIIEIGSAFKAYRTAVGTFEGVLIAIAGKYIKLVEEGGDGKPAEAKPTETSDLPPIDENMIPEGGETREPVVKKLET
jgi:hypothetical protein